MSYSSLKEELDLRLYRAHAKYRDVHNELSAEINKARQTMFDEQEAAEKDFILALGLLSDAHCPR